MVTKNENLFYVGYKKKEGLSINSVDINYRDTTKLQRTEFWTPNPPYVGPCSQSYTMRIMRHPSRLIFAVRIFTKVKTLIGGSCGFLDVAKGILTKSLSYTSTLAILISADFISANLPLSNLRSANWTMANSIRNLVQQPSGGLYLSEGR